MSPVSQEFPSEGGGGGGGGPSLSGRPAGGLCSLVGIDDPVAAHAAVGGPIRSWMATDNPVLWSRASNVRDPDAQALRVPSDGAGDQTWYARWATDGYFVDLAGILSAAAIQAAALDGTGWRAGGAFGEGNAILVTRLALGGEWLSWVLAGETPAAAELTARGARVETDTSASWSWAGLCVVRDGAVVAGASLGATTSGGAAQGDIVIDVAALLPTWHRCAAYWVARVGSGSSGANYATVRRLGLEITA